MTDVNAMLNEILELLAELSEDTSVPRNIRKSAAEARARLMKKDEPLDVRAASAIFILDEMANDPNIPVHGRTMVYTIIGKLEALSSAASR